MRSSQEAVRLIAGFRASAVEEKSRELILALLEHTSAPFSRDQFLPGHITCTALVLDPGRERALLIHHHRHLRWLLPGGHVEESDTTLGEAARREAVEETEVRIAGDSIPRLVGMDVHGIPAHKGEPFHLHHDLIFAFEAESTLVNATEEAPKAAWIGPHEMNEYGIPPSIVCAFMRAAGG